MGGGTFHTKEELKLEISGRMSRFPKIQYTEPTSVRIRGETAQVKIWLRFNEGGRNYRLFYTIDVVKENDNWLVIREAYSTL